MTSFEQRWRDALLMAVIPPIAGANLPTFQSMDLSAFWSRYQKAAPLFLRVGFRLAVVALTWMPLIRTGRPFHRLPPDAQDAFLQRTAESRSYVLRQLVTVVKLIACFAFFFDAGVQQAVREPFLLAAAP